MAKEKHHPECRFKKDSCNCNKIEKRKEIDGYDHRFMEEITCPHCGNEWSDSWEIEDDRDEVCDECDGKFYIKIRTKRTYSTDKLDEDGDEAL